MRALDDPGAELTRTELRDLCRLAGFMVPASAGFGVPGANDDAIFADIVRSLGRDWDAVRAALAAAKKWRSVKVVSYPRNHLYLCSGSSHSSEI
jgi:hypothetical protein